MTILQRIGQMHRDKEVSQHSRDFATIARLVMRHKSLEGATLFLEKNGSRSVGPRIADIVKAAVPAMGLTGSNIADYSAIASGFVGSLSSSGAFDAMLASMTPVPLATGTVGQVNVGATAYSLAEGSMKPITKLSIGSSQLTPQKAHAVVVVTQELARSAVPGSLALIERMLRNAVAVQTDAAFFSAVLSGVSGLTSSGQTAEAVRTDISYMLRLMTTGQGSALFIATTPLICKVWSMLTDQRGVSAFPELGPQGGLINKIPVLVSDGLSAGQVVLVDASGIAGAPGTADVENFEHGIIASDSAPDSPVTASTTMESLWQANKTAVRVERYFAGIKLRTDAVQLSTNSNSYQSGNSPA